MWCVPFPVLPHCRTYLRKSGIFGYINYLVERDRKYILDTLVKGKSSPALATFWFDGLVTLF